MVEPINFNKARKAKLRSDKEKRTAENRIKFGRTNAEKKVAKTKSDKLKKHIDDHELDS